MDESHVSVSSDSVVVNGGNCFSRCMTLYLLSLQPSIRNRSLLRDLVRLAAPSCFTGRCVLSRSFPGHLMWQLS